MAGDHLNLGASHIDFIWHDGGRASSGFVGAAGDCVTRAIAIATGIAYRSIYNDLKELNDGSPRDGVLNVAWKAYLMRLGWHRQDFDCPLDELELPGGIAILSVISDGRRKHGHLCTLIGSTIYDTWNPADDSDMQLCSVWTPPAHAESPITMPAVSGQQACRSSTQTQKEFDKVLARIKALERTATNHASTEGEQRNALRMMQIMMLKHNLSREDLVEDDNTDGIAFTRVTVPVNGKRSYQWECNLAGYVTREVFGTVQRYKDRKANRTYFYFYGPREDVMNCVALFRELLLAIAASAKLRYGGYARGSGASYCEGFVRGLPRSGDVKGQDATFQEGLIHARTLAVQQASKKWLSDECGIDLVSCNNSGRQMHDAAAENQGRKDGAKQNIKSGKARLTYRG